MDISPVVNLGIGGFAILVMWWMYQSAASERSENYKQMELLQSDIRNKFSAQLMENTNALNSHTKIMGTVLKLLENINSKQ